MAKLIIPPGKKTGCLPRVSRYGEWFPRLEDRIDVIPQGEWEGLLGEDPYNDMEKHTPWTLDQDGIGSCAMESSGGATMGTRSFTGQPHVLLNPLSGYAFTSGGRDQGSNIDTNLRHMQEVGMLPEIVWPRSKGFRIKPPQKLLDEVACRFRIDEVWDIASVAEVGTALLKKFFVVFGWRGHSCFLLKLLNKYRGLYKNSWAASWGDNGNGTIELADINFGYGAWAVRSVVDSGPASEEWLLAMRQKYGI